MSEILTAASIYFVYWLYNYSQAFDFLNQRIVNWENHAKTQENLLLEKFLYPLRCPLCFSWWVSLFLYIINYIADFREVCFNALFALFVDLIFRKLVKK